MRFANAKQCSLGFVVFFVIPKECQKTLIYSGFEFNRVNTDIFDGGICDSLIHPYKCRHYPPPKRQSTSSNLALLDSRDLFGVPL